MNRKMVGPIACFFAVLTLATLSLASPVRAQTFDQNRAINAAGKQRMLSQKMSKEILLVALGVDASENLANLRRSHALFDRTLTALRAGDTALGLEAPKSQQIQASLDSTIAVWREMDAVIRGILESGQAAPERVGTIATMNPRLLTAMENTVAAYQAEFATTNLNEALVTAINLSGRQRMLSQKMSKEYLLIAYGHDVERNRQQLDQTVAAFERTLLGLIDGDTNMRLLPAPNDEIAEQLTKINAIWKDFAPLVMNGLVGGGTSEPEMQAFAQQNLMLLKEVDAVVLMYEKFARKNAS